MVVGDRNLLYLLFFSLFLNVCSSILGVSSVNGIELQFESIFPDSPYKHVYIACVDMWQDLRTQQEKSLTEAEITHLNERLIGSLIGLKSSIESMFNYPQCCSPDDLEYLMEILHLIHCEYVHMTHYKMNEMSICIAVLFDHMQKFLSKPFLIQS